MKVTMALKNKVEGVVQSFRAKFEQDREFRS